MKLKLKIVKYIYIMALLLCCISCNKAKGSHSSVVEFEDPAFKNAFKEAEFSERGKVRSIPFEAPTEKQIQQITSLNLNFHGVEDYSLKDIKKFPNLKGLYIAGPTNKAILEIKEMTQLKALHIECNDPDIDLDPIGDMKNIVALGITGKQSRNWGFVDKMTQLESIYLFFLTTDNLNFMKSMSHLERLIIDHSNILDVSGLKGLSGVKYLIIECDSGGDTSDYSSALSKMKSIELIDINGLPLKNLDFLKEMKSLKWLSLAEVGNIQLPDWLNAESYHELRRITLDKTTERNNIEFLNKLRPVLVQRGEVKNLFWDERLAFPNSLEIMNDLDNNDKRWDK